MGADAKPPPSTMSTKALDDVREDAMALPLDDRAELARELLSSLDGPVDPDAQRAWDVELCLRINKLRSGEATLLDPDDVLARARQRLKRG
jgi:putative addiction module component (TIGR02574 family)